MVIELTRKSKANLTQVLNRGDVFLNFLVYEHKNFFKKFRFKNDGLNDFKSLYFEIRPRDSIFEKQNVFPNRK